MSKPSPETYVVSKALVIPDLQIRAPRRGEPEGEWSPALEAVAHYAEDNAPWDHIVQIGDFLDLPYFSQHKDAQLYSEEAAIEAWEEDKERGAQWLARFGCLGDNNTIIEGNHDFRATSNSPWLKKRPHLNPLVNMAQYVRQNGWDWVPYWSENKLLKIGKAHIGHGRYANKYHAEKHSRIYNGINFFYGHCFDGATELLTDKGWRNVSKIKIAETLATLNVKNGLIEYQQVDRTVSHPNWTRMFKVESSNVELAVTDGHELVRTHASAIIKETAENVSQRATSKFVCGANTTDPEGPYSDDWLRLIVWIAADGCLEYSNTNFIRFHLRKERKILRLEALLKLLEIEYRKNIQAQGTTKISFNLEIPELDWRKKCLPRLALSSRQKRTMLEEYIHTDGSITGPRTFQISTSKKSEADLLQEMAVTAGYRCNLTPRPGGSFILSLNSNPTPEVRKTAFTTYEGTEPVYCVQVPNGTVVSRRGGKVTIAGNCHDVQSYAPVIWKPGVTPVSQSIGCLCNLYQSWLGGSPHNWVHAFMEVHFLNNGNFTYYIIRMYDDKFVSPDGNWIYSS
jgi:hypothetical protein